jgi:protein-S-isoprenylcysteine O-methyltransferase Ste14
VYIVLAIQFEERDLVTEYGLAYQDYQRRVPMLVPGTLAAAPEPKDRATASIAR